MGHKDEGNPQAGMGGAGFLFDAAKLQGRYSVVSRDKREISPYINLRLEWQYSDSDSFCSLRSVSPVIKMCR